MKYSKRIAVRNTSVLVLIISLASMISGCNDTGREQIDDRVEITARETTNQMDDYDFEEPNQSIATIETTTEATTEETTEETTVETTAAPPVTAVTGEFDWTLYEGTEYQTTIYMDLNPVYFIASPWGDNTMYSLQTWELADQYGWLEDGQWGLYDLYDDCATDRGTHTLGFSPVYTYQCDGYRVYMYVEYYDDLAFGPHDECQIKSISVSYVQDDSTEPAFENPSPEQMDVIINFARHPDDCEYICDPKPFGGSVNDIMIYQYIIWACSKYPGDSSVLYGYFQNPTIVDGRWVIELP